MKNSFIFYTSFYEAIKELEDDTQLKLYQAIMEFALNEKEIELTGIAKAIFALIKPQISANNKRYEDGCRGGRPKRESQKNKEKAPTLLEIKSYCKQIGRKVNAEDFFNFYSAANWIDKNGTAVNWKQKIISWAKGEKLEGVEDGRYNPYL